MFDECTGSVGVVHVARAVMSVEDLAGLGDGCEQRVVAAPALLLLVVSDCGALGMALGAQHRAVEVERDPCRFYKLILLRLGLESIKVVIQFPLDTRVRIDRQHPFVARTSQSSDSTQ